MKVHIIFLVSLLGSFAMGAADVPDPLGDVSGVIVSPFIRNATFELTWAPLTACKRTKISKEVTFFKCGAKGASVLLTSGDGKVSRVLFDKCFIFNYDNPDKRSQYFFNGLYTERSERGSYETVVLLALWLRPNDPLNVWGKLSLRDFDVNYALAGKRKSVGDALATRERAAP